jgi:hypothetical protein
MLYKVFIFFFCISTYLIAHDESDNTIIWKNDVGKCNAKPYVFYAQRNAEGTLFCYGMFKESKKYYTLIIPRNGNNSIKRYQSDSDSIAVKKTFENLQKQYSVKSKNKFEKKS